MNETMCSSSEWKQLYQQTFDSSFGFSDATTVTTISVTSGNNLNPSSSFAAGDHFTPKGCVSKPTRRRSRASKRTSITLLNADAKNFRSLVQQFTGCRRRATSISFGNQRGPVNINFALGTEHDHHNTHPASVLSEPFVENNGYCSGQSSSQLQQQEEHQQNYQQLSSEEQEREFSLDSITPDDYLLTSCLPRSGPEIPQGLAMDDMYFLA
ncbi:VQ motif-containing protein 22-like [Herrania umbratica]|uniref:VQ motif-containing protein 22-like n=1 Tax=Herrania umbratica TaxID=108875 RepID=A0A6J1BKX6_9ROSI|nr:VQ motif-containing protein 22-like [Herrania umbratica]